uniref:Uncharacterized protein n=1 Tax=Panagrolaimus superbus TaxID=310955 RepID=A0A914Z8P6_9BILA
MKQTTLLRSIAIIGIILSCSILISSIYSLFAASFGIFPLIIYCYIFLCAKRQRRRIFRRAIFALGGLAIIDFLLFIFFVVIGFLQSENDIKNYNTNNDTHETKAGVQTENFICAFIALLLTIYMIFTLIFVEKARRQVFQTCHEIPIYHSGYNGSSIIFPINGAPPRYSVVMNEGSSQSFSSPA